MSLGLNRNRQSTNAKSDPHNNETPNEYVIRRVNLILNNITKVNFEVKSVELKRCLSLFNSRWLASLIIDRIANQSNSFEIYQRLIVELNDNWNMNLMKIVLSDLTLKIDDLLKPNRMNFDNGRHLRVYGRLLGRLILSRDLEMPVDLKILLFVFNKKYPRDLEYIVTFIVNILREARHGKRFSLKNPWLIDNLQALKELYELTDKLAIQFEIEELFRNLDCPLADVKASYYLRQN